MNRYNDSQGCIGPVAHHDMTALLVMDEKARFLQRVNCLCSSTLRQITHLYHYFHFINDFTGGIRYGKAVFAQTLYVALNGFLDVGNGLGNRIAL